MTPGETFEIKRTNFIRKTKRLFHFLVSEWGFDEPVYRFHEQENGTVTRDEFLYARNGQDIIILNAYHPYDYGFEINSIDPTSGDKELILLIKKEDQDLEQSYLEGAADRLKSRLSAQ